MRKVTTITSKINLSGGESISVKMFLPTKENKMTTAILIKLLATNNVAKSFLGLSRSFEIILPLELFSCNVSSISFEDKEKNATSAPATIAEKKSKTNIPTKPIIKLVSAIAEKNKLGSGSKSKKLVKH